MSRPIPAYDEDFAELRDAVSGLRGNGSVYTPAWRSLQRTRAQRTRRIKGK
jgi:hypothetical protein